MTQDPAAARAALQDNFCYPVFHLELAKSLLDHGEPQRAFLICEATRQRFGDEQFDVSFAEVFLGEHAELSHPEMEALETAVKLDPKNLTLVKQLARVELLRRRSWQALQYLQRAHQQVPDDESIMLMLRQALEMCNQSAQADQLFQIWITQHPDSLSACRTSVETQLKSDSVASAFDAALKKFPTDGPLRLMHAQWLHDRQQDMEAEAEFIAAADDAPTDANAQVGAAHFLLTEKSDRARAFPYYLAAYFLDPHCGDWTSAAEHIRGIAAETPAMPLDAALEGDHPFAALACLDRIDHPPLDLCWKAATDDVPQIAWAAVQKMKSADATALEPKLSAALKSDDLRLRAAAEQMSILRNAPPVQVKEWLSDKNDLICYRCAIAALETGNDSLRDLVRQQSWQNTRDAAIRAELGALVQASQ